MAALVAAGIVLTLNCHRSVAQEKLTAKEAAQIGEEAYIYGYSLITTEITRVQMTNVSRAEELRGPMGQFINVSRYPPANYRGVSAPNADTLYSVAWLDLGSGPIVFSHPDMGKRYYLFPMYSQWTPVFASPGSRTAGEGAKTYLITGPTWKGVVPTGMERIKSPTRYLVILGRTYCTGTPEDYEAVHALQAQYKLQPLRSYGKPYTPPPAKVDSNPGFSMTEKPQVVINDMNVSTYFNMMSRLMSDSAYPAPEDAPIMIKLAKLGFEAGTPFDLAKLAPDVQAALKNVPKTAYQKIMAQQHTGGKLVNGWLIPAAAGRYGTDYLARALIAAVGWGANLPEDAVYPVAQVDGEGKKLNGASKYTITFAREQTPPVGGFWSITMYFDDGGWWFYPNDLNKFTVSMRNKPKFNDDGSLTLHFQHGSPGKDKEANWLPAPKGDFILTMRLYWPRPQDPSILNGTWIIPPVTKVN
jgi:hypothetical protein